MLDILLALSTEARIAIFSCRSGLYWRQPNNLSLLTVNSVDASGSGRVVCKNQRASPSPTKQATPQVGHPSKRWPVHPKSPFQKETEPNGPSIYRGAVCVFGVSERSDTTFRIRYVNASGSTDFVFAG